MKTKTVIVLDGVTVILTGGIEIAPNDASDAGVTICHYPYLGAQRAFLDTWVKPAKISIETEVE